MKTSVKYFIIAVILFAAMSARAATVIFIIGDVWKKSGGSWQRARAQEPLPSGTIIKTGDRSLAILALTDGSGLKPEFTYDRIHFNQQTYDLIYSILKNYF